MKINDFKILPFHYWIVMVFVLTGCAALSGGSGGKVGSIFFSIEDDKKLGKEVSAQIAANSKEYPILSQTQYPQAYQYLNAMKNQILQSGNVAYQKEFVWELKIIHNDKVLNAFATPGGYIYIYTGLIKYLDSADDLAGVLGHEIAHADRRHSIKQMEKSYGISMLASIALGQNPGQLTQIVAQLAGTGATLAFSRGDESEADEFSVKYLSNTTYACNGAASFFQKLEKQGQSGSTPTFMSTHPSPKSRVADINEKAKAMGCALTAKAETGMTYQQFKSSLPK